MVTLAIAIVVALAGALGAGFVAVRLTRRLGAHPRARIAQRAVALLAGLAGAEIATRPVELVQQLELDNELGPVTAIGSNAREALDAIDFAVAFREILFTGGLLIGLAALVGVAATRKYGDE